VLFVGRVVRWKGVDLLVRAVPKVLERHPEARFVFVGADNVGMEGSPTAEAYLRHLLPSRASRRLHFTGYLPHAEVAAYYKRATVCVFPSLFEAFGYTCLEAMTYSKAIVGSRHGGMCELLDEGRAGKLFTPPDVQGLADHLSTLLADPGLRTHLGEQARRRAQHFYGAETVLNDIEAFYRQALSDVLTEGGPRLGGAAQTPRWSLNMGAKR